MAFDGIVRPGALELPEAVVDTIQQDINTESVALRLGRAVPVPAGSARVPVISTLPTANWVDAKAPGKKQTSGGEFTNKTMDIFELATLVPVPDAYLEDASVDVFEVLRPYVARAIAAKFDAAALFGTDKPDNTLVSVAEHANNATQSAVETESPYADVLAAMKDVGTAGYNPSGVLVAPGYQYDVAANREGSLQFDPSAPIPSQLLGLPMLPVLNGSWDEDHKALVGDWSKLLVGVRRDITVEFSNSGVIRDNTGAITVSAFQDDVTIMRVTFRAGFLVVDEATPLGGGSPFSAVEVSGS